MNDEYVHFGDVVQIANLASGAVLAVDVARARGPRPAENACRRLRTGPTTRTRALATPSRSRNTVPRASAVLEPTYDDAGPSRASEGEEGVNPEGRGSGVADAGLKSFGADDGRRRVLVGFQP